MLAFLTGLFRATTEFLYFLALSHYSDFLYSEECSIYVAKILICFILFDFSSHFKIKAKF